MVIRSEAMIEGEIGEILQRAVADSRTPTDVERSRLDDLIIERAATFRVLNQRWRQEQYRQLSFS